MDADDNKVAGGMWGRRGKWADDVCVGRMQAERTGTHEHRRKCTWTRRTACAVNSRFVRADSVIRRGEYAVNPAMGAIYGNPANTWRIRGE